MGINRETLLTKCLSLDIELEHSFKEFYVSDITAGFAKVSKILLGEKIDKVNLVDINKYEGSSDRN